MFHACQSSEKEWQAPPRQTARPLYPYCAVVPTARKPACTPHCTQSDRGAVRGSSRTVSGIVDYRPPSNFFGGKKSTTEHRLQSSRGESQNFFERKNHLLRVLRHKFGVALCSAGLQGNCPVDLGLALKLWGLVTSRGGVVSLCTAGGCFGGLWCRGLGLPQGGGSPRALQSLRETLSSDVHTGEPL